jgi:hypothetical protein
MSLHYIIRNTFSLAELSYIEKTGTVIYRLKMSHGGNKQNFQIFTLLECGDYPTYSREAGADGPVLRLILE